MKKFLTIALLVMTMSVTAQTKKDSVSVKDSLTNQTPLISIADYELFNKELVQELPAKYADAIREWWFKKLQAIIQEKKKK